jgi:hypothetical protein
MIAKTNLIGVDEDESLISQTIPTQFEDTLQWMKGDLLQVQSLLEQYELEQSKLMQQMAYLLKPMKTYDTHRNNGFDVKSFFKQHQQDMPDLSSTENADTVVDTVEGVTADDNDDISDNGNTIEGSLKQTNNELSASVSTAIPSSASLYSSVKYKFDGRELATPLGSGKSRNQVKPNINNTVNNNNSLAKSTKIRSNSLISDHTKSSKTISNEVPLSADAIDESVSTKKLSPIKVKSLKLSPQRPVTNSSETSSSTKHNAWTAKEQGTLSLEGKIIEEGIRTPRKIEDVSIISADSNNCDKDHLTSNEGVSSSYLLPSVIPTPKSSQNKSISTLKASIFDNNSNPIRSLKLASNSSRTGKPPLISSNSSRSSSTSNVSRRTSSNATQLMTSVKQSSKHINDFSSTNEINDPKNVGLSKYQIVTAPTNSTAAACPRNISHNSDSSTTPEDETIRSHNIGDMIESVTHSASESNSNSTNISSKFPRVHGSANSAGVASNIKIFPSSSLGSNQHFKAVTDELLSPMKPRANSHHSRGENKADYNQFPFIVNDVMIEDNLHLPALNQNASASFADPAGSATHEVIKSKEEEGFELNKEDSLMQSSEVDSELTFSSNKSRRRVEENDRDDEKDDDNLTELERRFLRCVAIANIKETLSCIHAGVDIHVKNIFDR